MQLRQHQNNFDFLRLMAAMMVVVYHSYPLLYANYYHDWLFNLTGHCSSGSICLDVFFVMSGFLITQSYCRRPTCIEFFKGRVLRIFPALMVSMLLIVLVVGAIFTQLSWQDYFTNAYTWRYFVGLSLFKLQFNLPQVFTENFHHTSSVNGSIWSLSYEWTMYALLFFFGKIGFLKPTKINLILHGLIIGLMVYLDVHPSLTTISFLGIKSVIIVHLYSLFMMGSWLFLLKDKININHLTALVVFMIWVLTFHTVYCAIISVIAIPILVIWFAFLPINIFKKITATGDYSYGIYVFGFPIQQIIIQLTKGNIGIYQMIGLSLFLSLAVAILSYHFIEKPVLNWKKKR